jgi:hypothetical protein
MFPIALKPHLQRRSMFLDCQTYTKTQRTHYISMLVIFRPIRTLVQLQLQM